jgi:hypothetical protein
MQKWVILTLTCVVFVLLTTSANGCEKAETRQAAPEPEVVAVRRCPISGKSLDDLPPEQRKAVEEHAAKKTGGCPFSAAMRFGKSVKDTLRSALSIIPGLGDL